MKKYLITYDLKSVSGNYAPLYDAIKKIGDWWHYLDSTWIVKTDLGSKEIFDLLRPSLNNPSDYIFIVEIVDGSHYGWLPGDAWDWLIQ